MPNSRPLLCAHISVDYPQRPGVLRDLHLEVRHGEILGLAGQSGAGKSTLALALLRLLDHHRGKVHGNLMFNDRDLLALREREMREVRGREIGLVLQCPASSLNPALRIGTQLAEAWKAHASGTRSLGDHQIQQALHEVQLPSDGALLRRFPSEISVGQAQRVVLAMAILHRPALLIADEPTSALDLITQSEILALLVRLNRELGMAILCISHDLIWLAQLCHRLAILHQGSIVECAATHDLFTRPSHPYTQQLVRALPRLSATVAWKRAVSG